MKTIGPSTRNDANMKFEIAKPRIGARTHPRDVTSLNPSRISDANDRSGARMGASTSSRARNAALAMNDPASIANTYPGPATASRSPDTAGPNTFSVLRLIPSSAFAD